MKSLNKSCFFQTIIFYDGTNLVITTTDFSVINPNRPAVGQSNIGKQKQWYLFQRKFQLLRPKPYFWKGDRPLGSAYNQLLDFQKISQFSKIHNFNDRLKTWWYHQNNHVT